MSGCLQLDPELFEKGIKIEKDTIYAVTIPKTHVRHPSNQMLGAGEYI